MVSDSLNMLYFDRNLENFVRDSNINLKKMHLSRFELLHA